MTQSLDPMFGASGLTRDPDLPVKGLVRLCLLPLRLTFPRPTLELSRSETFTIAIVNSCIHQRFNSSWLVELHVNRVLTRSCVSSQKILASLIEDSIVTCPGRI